MSTTTPNDDVRSIMDQRRQRFLFNRPNVRLELVSPYPKYTAFQLNMRRKAEILKYDGSRQASMSNSFTRKENWSKIVSGSTSIKTTNYNIDNNLINTGCIINKNLPTLTTRCDVPGIPILLYNDPDVPLYNYNNQMYNRTYATEIIEETAKWYAFTKQYTEFFKLEELYVDEDVVGTTPQTRTIDIGVIEITKLHTDSTQVFNLNIPIAFWIMGVQHDITLDTTEYNYDQLFNSSLGKDIIVTLKTAVVNVYYNETLINLDIPCTVDIGNVKSFVFNTKNLTKDYYALQYIGNINVSNLILPTSSGYIYTVKMVVTYEYPTDISDYIRLFSSGVIPHVDSKNSLDTHNCIIASKSPEYTDSSFAYYPIGTKEIYYPV